MPAARCPVRPVRGTGVPSPGVRSARYDVGMATAVMPPAEKRISPAPACIHLAFRLGGRVLSLDVADDAARHLIEDAYAPLLCPAEGVRAHASMRRLTDGRLHVRYGRQALRLANTADAVPLRAAHHAAREIFARFASEPPNIVALYGSLCAIDRGAVLLLGPPAIGKTLLALHLARSGARFLGDETAVLSLTTSEVYAMPRRPALRESALPLLPHPSMAEAVASSASAFPTDRGRFWYALDSAALCGIEPSARPYALRAICILRERTGSASIRRLDSAEGVKLTAQRAYVRPTSLTQLAALRRATRHAEFFEMTLGSPQSSSETLLREVRARC